MESGRKALSKVRRIIVKIGSNALADRPELVPDIAAEIAEQSALGRSFVIVSSGAVALGSVDRRPRAPCPQLPDGAGTRRGGRTWE